MTFGSAIAGLAIAPHRAVAILGDDYVNRKLGVAFRKPPGWVFSDVMEMGVVAKGQILQLNDRELLKELWSNSSLPVLTLSKLPISRKGNRFVPGVHVFLDRMVVPKELKEIGVDVASPMEAIADDINSNTEVLREFRVLGAPVSRPVSKCAAAEYVAEFLFEHVNLVRPVKVRMRTVCIWQKPGFYTLRMYDAPRSGSANTVNYDEFIQSVRMV